MEIKKNSFIMGTKIEISITPPLTPPFEGGEYNALYDIEFSFNIFKSLEKEFSRFDKNSSLSKLNKNKKLKISSDFLEVFNLSKDIFEKTEGYFNPLINISNIGYSENFLDNNFKKTNIDSDLNFEEIKIIGNILELTNNQNLDFGGIVKGYAVDKVKGYLENKNYNDFIINAGGDIFVKTPPLTTPLQEGDNSKCIAIDSPKNNGDIFALLDLKNMSLSTSGTYKRNWKIKEKKYHHILNPKTNKNNDEIISISLIGEKCYLTDAYATACIAMGIEKSLEFLNKQNIAGVIIGSDYKIYKVGNLEKYNFEII